MFKGKSLTIGAGDSVTIARRHAFRPITTRVYHPGMHRLEVMLNGGQVAICDFHLNMPMGDKG